MLCNVLQQHCWPTHVQASGTARQAALIAKRNTYDSLHNHRPLSGCIIGHHLMFSRCHLHTLSAAGTEELLRELNSGGAGVLRDEDDQDWGLDDVAGVQFTQKPRMLHRPGRLGPPSAGRVRDTGTCTGLCASLASHKPRTYVQLTATS